MEGYRTPTAQSRKQGSSHGTGSESAGNSSVNMENSRSRNVQPKFRPIVRTPQSTTPETASPSDWLRDKPLQSFSSQLDKEFSISDDVHPSDNSSQTSGSHLKREGSGSLNARSRNKSSQAGRSQLKHTSPPKGFVGASSGNTESSRSHNVQPRTKSLQAVDLQLKDCFVSPNFRPITRIPQSSTPETASSEDCPMNISLRSFSPQLDKEFSVSDDVHSSDRSSQTSGSQLKREGAVSLNARPRNKSSQAVRLQLRHTSPNKVIGDNNAISSEGGQEKTVFDIFRIPSDKVVKLQRSLLEINKEKRKEAQYLKDAPQHEHLSEGMVLLKRYIGHDDQVRIAKKCRDLGISEGGFYKPGYDDGAKLHLQMMCLGKNWDPVSRLYTDKRPTDGAAIPKIPEEFLKLVSGALESSHEVIKKTKKKKNAGVIVEEELPLMSPEICIVNFYPHDGRLGLHQDKDESAESIRRGLPVVSFSIGDSAEFVYGEDRDETMAKKVLLKSGDVLIFGGKSRMIFHGVRQINKNTAPKRLLDDTNLKPGRLNLTFRQY